MAKYEFYTIGEQPSSAGESMRANEAFAVKQQRDGADDVHASDQTSSADLAEITKVSLGCAGFHNIHCFIWLDADQFAVQIQFIFDDSVLEWHRQRGMCLSKVDRGMALPLGDDIRFKEIQLSEDAKRELDKGVEIVKNSRFPIEYEMFRLRNFIKNF